tara:strand:- start:138 stop:383 length:246 start_codon:yes stop_codon:yes gene_type:complete
MTATVAKKPRAAKRRKPKPMTTQSYEVKKEEKVAPTSTKQLPVVITEQRRTLKDLTLFELGLLPFLYLELLAKKLYNRFSK